MANPEFRQLSKMLKKAGFELKNQKGSHAQFQHLITNRKITVPIRMKNGRMGHSGNIKRSVQRQIEEILRKQDERSTN